MKRPCHTFGTQLNDAVNLLVCSAVGRGRAERSVVCLAADCVGEPRLLGDALRIAGADYFGRDPHGIVDRLIAQLKKHELSATFAVVPVISKTLSINVAPAVEKVYAAKKLNKKGR